MLELLLPPVLGQGVGPFCQFDSENNWPVRSLMQVDARHVPMLGSRCWPLFLRLLRYQSHGRQRNKKGWGTEARYFYEEKCFCALLFFCCLSPSCFSLPSFPSGSNLLGWFLFSASWFLFVKFPPAARCARGGEFFFMK